MCIKLEKERYGQSVSVFGVYMQMVVYVCEHICHTVSLQQG